MQHPTLGRTDLWHDLQGPSRRATGQQSRCAFPRPTVTCTSRPPRSGACPSATTSGFCLRKRMHSRSPRTCTGTTGKSNSRWAHEQPLDSEKPPVSLAAVGGPLSEDRSKGLDDQIAPDRSLSIPRFGIRVALAPHPECRGGSLCGATPRAHRITARRAVPRLWLDPVLPAVRHVDLRADAQSLECVVAWPSASAQCTSAPSWGRTCCRSLEPVGTPETEERHLLSLAARWGGVSGHERAVVLSSATRARDLFSVALRTRHGVSPQRGGDPLG